MVGVTGPIFWQGLDIIGIYLQEASRMENPSLESMHVVLVGEF